MKIKELKLKLINEVKIIPSYFSFINGKHLNKGIPIEVKNPTTNKSLGVLIENDHAQFKLAFTSAQEAFQKWKLFSNEKRIIQVNKIGKLLQDYKSELALSLTNELAKSTKLANEEIENAISYLEQAIIIYKNEFMNNLNYYSPKVLNNIHKSAIFPRIPLGVVFTITPSNYPISLLITKIVPALLMGNTIIVKAPTNGSITTGLFFDILSTLNLLPGIINFIIIPGNKINWNWIEKQPINLVNFTGSYKVGKLISEKYTLKPLILELGGKDLAIVTKNADLDLSAKEIIKGAFTFNGQRCTAIKRVIVDEKIAPLLISKLLLSVKTLKVGAPENKDVDITPLYQHSTVIKNRRLIDDALAKGASLLTPLKITNNLIEPLIISNVTTSMLLAWEEQFGPVLPILTYKNIQEAITYQNESNYGLQCSIFLKTDKKIKNFKNDKILTLLFNNLEVGTININKASSRGPNILPFQGIKHSGLGIQGIKDSFLNNSRPLGLVLNLK